MSRAFFSTRPRGDVTALSTHVFDETETLLSLVKDAVRSAADRVGAGEEAVALLRESDARRAGYLQRVYGLDEESPTDDDSLVDTERLTRGAAVDVIVGLVGSHPITDETGYGQASVRYARTG